MGDHHDDSGAAHTITAVSSGWARIECTGCGHMIRTRVSGTTTTCGECRARVYVPVGAVRSRVGLDCLYCGHEWASTAAGGATVRCPSCQRPRRVPSGARDHELADALDSFTAEPRPAPRRRDIAPAPAPRRRDVAPAPRRPLDGPSPLVALAGVAAAIYSRRQVPAGARPLSDRQSATPTRPAPSRHQAPRGAARGRAAPLAAKVHDWPVNPQGLPGRCVFARRQLDEWSWCDAFAAALYVPTTGPSSWLPVWPLDSQPAGSAYPICEGCCHVLNRQRLYVPAP